MIYGILVSYYDQYKNDAVTEFVRILNGLGHDFRVILINNNPLNQSEHVYNNKFTLLQGSNTGWEFSAWDEAILHLKNTNVKFSSDDYFLFANDTFNQHRFFTCYDRYLFKNAFLSKMHNNHPLLIGEVNSFQQDFNISKYTGREWVSSYLFFTNFAFVENISQFDMFDRVISEPVVDEEKSLIKFDDLISVNLALHLNRWIFPEDKRKGWYGVGDNSFLIKKLKAIINEKLLSLRCVQNGYLINVYSSRISSFYLRLKYFIYNEFR